MVLFKIIDILFLAYTIMLFVRVFSSWIPEWQNSQVIRFIAFYTDPYLRVFRQLIPPLGMMDISPIIAFFCLQLIQGVFKWILFQIIH